MWSTYNPDRRTYLEALDDPPQSNRDDFSSIFANEFIGDDDHPYAFGCCAVETIGLNVLKHMSRRNRPRNRQVKSTSGSKVECFPPLIIPETQLASRTIGWSCARQ